MKHRRVEADMTEVAALDRRTQLGWIVSNGPRVRIDNPLGGTWTGRIIGLADHPAMLVELDNGDRTMLPQCFAVEQIPYEQDGPERTAPGQEGFEPPPRPL